MISFEVIINNVFFVHQKPKQIMTSYLKIIYIWFLSELTIILEYLNVIVLFIYNYRILLTVFKKKKIAPFPVEYIK